MSNTDSVDIITFVLDEDETVENFINKFLYEKASFNVIRFIDPYSFKKAIEDNSNVRLVILDVELSKYKEYKLKGMIDFLHKERTGTYIIVVADFERTDPVSFDLTKDFIRLGVFDLVDKNDKTWEDDLKSSLTRVTKKIIFKIQNSL